MNKYDYIKMLIQENNKPETQKLYADLIDCIDIALSQESVSFEINSSIGLNDLFQLIKDAAKKNSQHCVGPFEAAELIAQKLGASYRRPSRKFLGQTNGIVNLEDFL